MCPLIENEEPNRRMPTSPTTLRQLICTGLLPFIGFLPFIVLLHRDFAEFQSTSPATARTQHVPFSPARAVASVIGIVSVCIGIHRFAAQLDAFPPLAGTSWQRLCVLFAYCIAFFGFIYFTPPPNYWVW